ncbi:unnamed protein product [Amoebophrya sp. A25]|nr:unnamed protein product [Amoebophrya sp. A25]|eukprot:GSA25T00007015001.1
MFQHQSSCSTEEPMSLSSGRCTPTTTCASEPSSYTSSRSSTTEVVTTLFPPSRIKSTIGSGYSTSPPVSASASAHLLETKSRGGLAISSGYRSEDCCIPSSPSNIYHLKGRTSSVSSTAGHVGRTLFSTTSARTSGGGGPLNKLNCSSPRGLQQQGACMSGCLHGILAVWNYICCLHDGSTTGLEKKVGGGQDGKFTKGGQGVYPAASPRGESSAANKETTHPAPPGGRPEGTTGRSLAVLGEDGLPMRLDGEDRDVDSSVVEEHSQSIELAGHQRSLSRSHSGAFFSCDSVSDRDTKSAGKVAYSRNLESLAFDRKNAQDDAFHAKLLQIAKAEGLDEVVEDSTYIWQFVFGYSKERNRDLTTETAFRAALAERKKLKFDARPARTKLTEEQAKLVGYPVLHLGYETTYGYPIMWHQIDLEGPRREGNRILEPLLQRELCVAENIRRMNKRIGDRSASSHLQYKTFAIFDMAGKVEGGHLGRVASFFGDFIKRYQHFSPDSAYKIYLINCPFVFRAVWRGFSIFIPQATKEKIKLVGADYEGKLKKEGVVLILNPQTKDKATDFGKLSTEVV